MTWTARRKKTDFITATAATDQNRPDRPGNLERRPTQFERWRTLAKAKRVHEIAKTLGVKSKSIVTKCEAEGIPGITNHMSSVSAGLEATIREWFASGEAEGEARHGGRNSGTSRSDEGTGQKRAAAKKKAVERCG